MGHQAVVVVVVVTAGAAARFCFSALWLGRTAAGQVRWEQEGQPP
jgi:hypothetical protein